MADLGFWALAQDDPDYLGLVTPEGEDVTAGTLLGHANQVVHALRAQGFQTGDVVATLLPNGQVLVVGGRTSDAYGDSFITGSAELYDPALVAFNLEVCTDALRAFQQKSGTQTIAEPLRRALRRLVWHLNRIEIGGNLRARPAAGSAPRPVTR